MKNLNNNIQNTGINISGFTNGFTVPLGSTLEEKINQLQEIKNGMVDCLFQCMNDEVGLNLSTIALLQNFYLEADRQLQELQIKKSNKRAFS